MKYSLLACFVFLLLAASVHAANVTLNFAECQVDANSTNMYCAPAEPLINQSDIYHQCIIDTNARFDTLNQSFNSIAQNVSSITSQLNLSLANLNISDVVGRYTSCIVSLNASISNATFWYGEAQQAQQEVGQVQSASNNKIDPAQLTTCQNTVNSLQSQLSQASGDKNTYAAIGFAIGLGVMWYFKGRKGPSGESDTRGDRAPLPGRV